MRRSLLALLLLASCSGSAPQPQQPVKVLADFATEAGDAYEARHALSASKLDRPLTVDDVAGAATEVALDALAADLGVTKDQLAGALARLNAPPPVHGYRGSTPASSGGMGGYDAADALCIQLWGAGVHVCEFNELRRSSTPAPKGRYAHGGHDCGALANGTTGTGVVWGEGFGRVCDEAWPLLCCQ